MGNPLTAYKHFSSNSSRTARNRRAGPKTFVYTRVASLGDFPLNCKFWGFFVKNVLGIFWTFKVLEGFFKNLGWQHCFHLTYTLQCKVHQNARSGEPYTF
jgi:hypothetical protein